MPLNFSSSPKNTTLVCLEAAAAYSQWERLDSRIKITQVPLYRLIMRTPEPNSFLAGLWNPISSQQQFTV